MFKYVHSIKFVLIKFCMIRLASLSGKDFEPKTAAIVMMYDYILKQEGINLGLNVLINQIDIDQKESIGFLNKRDVLLGICYEVPDNFKSFDSLKRNELYLNVIQCGLKYLGKYGNYPWLDMLDVVSSKLLEAKFSFPIILNEKVFQSNNVKLYLLPQTDKFDFYLQLEKPDGSIHKNLIYTGSPSNFYIKDLFGILKLTRNKIVVSGKKSEVDITLDIESGEFETVNKLGTNHSPYFNMFKLGADRKKEFDSYLKTVDPVVAAIVMNSPN